MDKPACNMETHYIRLERCIKKPENCAKIDDRGLGFCERCISDRFRIVSGICVEKVSCSTRQYVSNGGICVDANPGCSDFNPSNGKCISCDIPDTVPHQGFCCPKGQKYRAGQC